MKKNKTKRCGFLLMLLLISGCSECHCDCYSEVSAYTPHDSIHAHKFDLLHVYGEPNAIIQTPDSAKKIWWYRAMGEGGRLYEFYVFFVGDTAYGIRSMPRLY